MSVVKADLKDDGGLGEEAYLDALMERAPPAATLLNDVGHLQIFKGFLVFAAPDDADCDDDLLSKNKVERMLDPDAVQWEWLHTDLLAAIYDHRASSKNSAAHRSKAFIDHRFQLFHALAREHPHFLSTSSMHKKAT